MAEPTSNLTKQTKMRILYGNMMPTPVHLRDVLERGSEGIGEQPLTGQVKCLCGEKILHLLYPGKTSERGGEIYPCCAEIGEEIFFRIAIHCPQCGQEQIIFDPDLHGHDGVLCRKKQKVKPYPLHIWKCSRCYSERFTASVEITPLDKEIYMGELAEKYGESLWPEFFEWFTMNIRCEDCKHLVAEWISYETA